MDTEEEKFKLKQGFPRCPTCGTVMDWDTEYPEEPLKHKGYFFCWNDNTVLPDNRPPLNK